MIFDFLDKETQRYQEKKHLVNKDNSRYKEIYAQYADMVISPEHYCLSASDFIDIIEFFDSVEKNDKTIELLDHAKLCFINCVESYEDCLLAVKYVEEIKLPLFDDKSEAKSALMRLAYSYRRKELIKSGFAVEVPQTKSEDDFIQLVISYLVETIEALSNILMAVAVIGMLASIFFGLNLYATKRGIQRLKNLICDKCGAQLGDPENTTYEEVSHYWSDSSNSKRAASKLYVTVKFTCKCPKCGAVKSFNETLCSGEVSASNYSTNDTTVSTEKLVNDYLMGIIHF